MGDYEPHHSQSSEKEGEEGFVSLAEIAERCDVITLHTPLIKGGYHPTKHLADSNFFNSLARKPLFINSARGGVTDDKALLQAKLDGKISDFVIGVVRYSKNQKYNSENE